MFPQKKCKSIRFAQRLLYMSLRAARFGKRQAKSVLGVEVKGRVWKQSRVLTDLRVGSRGGATGHQDVTY